MPRSLMILPQRASSLLRMSPNSSGVVGAGTAPAAESLLGDFRIFQRRRNGAVELGDDRRRRLRRRQQRVPVVRVDVADSPARRASAHRAAPCRAWRDAMPSAAACRPRSAASRTGRSRKHAIDLAAEQVGQRGRRAAIGHVHDLDAGRAAGTVRARDAAGCRRRSRRTACRRSCALASCDQVLRRLDRRFRADHEHLRGVAPPVSPARNRASDRRAGRCACAASSRRRRAW